LDGTLAMVLLPPPDQRVQRVLPAPHVRQDQLVQPNQRDPLALQLPLVAGLQ
jgi:hypothetical protein